jgi:hypothetical protein
MGLISRAFWTLFVGPEPKQTDREITGISEDERLTELTTAATTPNEGAIYRELSRLRRDGGIADHVLDDYEKVERQAELQVGFGRALARVAMADGTLDAGEAAAVKTLASSETAFLPRGDARDPLRLLATAPSDAARAWVIAHLNAKALALADLQEVLPALYANGSQREGAAQFCAILLERFRASTLLLTDDARVFCDLVARDLTTPPREEDERTRAYGKPPLYTKSSLTRAAMLAAIDGVRALHGLPATKASDWSNTFYRPENLYAFDAKECASRITEAIEDVDDMIGAIGRGVIPSGYPGGMFVRAWQPQGLSEADETKTPPALQARFVAAQKAIAAAVQFNDNTGYSKLIVAPSLAIAALNAAKAELERARDLARATSPAE